MDQIKVMINALGRFQANLSGHKQIKFNDLNEDCTILILDQLNIGDLLSMAQTNQNLNLLAVDVFRRRFSKKKIIIHNYYGDDESERNESGIISKALNRFGITVQSPPNSFYMVYPDRVEISRDFNMSLNILKYFGSFIQKLKLVLANSETNASTKIIQFVNEYCYKSLIEFELDTSDGNAFRQMKNSFIHVERVTFRDCIPDGENGVFPLNIMFPAMRTLSLTPLRKIGNLINCRLPHLQHLYLDVQLCSAIDDLLLANPDLQSIELAQASSQFLQSVNTKLIKLEHLVLQNVEMNDDKIQFENVKKFIAGNALNPPKNIYFPNLRELHINFGICHFQEWINFLKNHNNLSQLQLNYRDIDDKHFGILTKELPNLMEISVLRSKGNFIGIYSIFRFIEMHPKLRKIHLDACRKDDYQVIREQFEFKWEIRNFRKGLSLEQT